jgi:hypothetical protein
MASSRVALLQAHRCIAVGGLARDDIHTLSAKEGGDDPGTALGESRMIGLLSGQIWNHERRLVPAPNCPRIGPERRLSYGVECVGIVGESDIG